jgi:hypothetical protein
MTTAYAVATGPLYAGHARKHDDDYLAFVRGQGRCAVRLCRDRHIEAAHTGPRGVGTKADDDKAVNLCRRHHCTGNKSLHKLGPVAFARLHRLDLATVIARLRAEYDGMAMKASQ